MSVRIPISDRARKYGYVIWPKKLEAEVKAILPQQESIVVTFNDQSIGERRIDWKYRRISVGPSHTRCLPDNVSTFEVSAPSAGKVAVKCV